MHDFTVRIERNALLMAQSSTSLALTFGTVDKNDNGLIELASGEMLANMANDLTGDGYDPDGAGPIAPITLGCPTICNGYELTGDIDLGSVLWEPIGNDTNPFSAAFDGNGHTISRLNIRADSESLGFFGVIGNSGVVTSSPHRGQYRYSYG